MKSQDSRGGFNQDISNVTDRLTNPPVQDLEVKRRKHGCNRGIITSGLLPLASYLLPLTSSLLLTPVKASLPNLTAKSRSCQAQDIKTLTAGLLQDLPAYANRASQRARRLSRTTDVYTNVILAGRPEFEPLTLGPGVYAPSQPTNSQVQQVFFTTLERQYTNGKAIDLQQFNWVFLTKTPSGWRLATMFSQIGGYPAKKPPTPPQETSNGIIAQGINAWLRDCEAEPSS